MNMKKLTLITTVIICAVSICMAAVFGLGWQMAGQHQIAGRQCLPGYL